LSIYTLDNGTCVISANNTWLPGVYENARAARFAFKLNDCQKSELRDYAVENSEGIISWQDIKDYRDKLKTIT